MATIGGDLRAARMRAGMSVAELASALGITDAYVRMVENGDKVPSGPLLQSWGRGLDLTVEAYSVVVLSGVEHRITAPLREAGRPTVGRARLSEDSLTANGVLEEILQLLIERLPQPQKEQ